MEKITTPVLYLSYDGLTDPLGESQVLPYLLGLQKPNRRITVISAEKPGRYERKKRDVENTIQNTNINWIPVVYHSSPPVISTLFDLFNIWRKARKIVLNSPHIIHCRSYPSSIIGLSLSRKYHCKFIFDMRGFWADERIDGEIWRLNNPIHRLMYKYFKKKEGQFFLESDAIVSLTSRGSREIVKMFEIAPEKISVIPCSADRELFNPEKCTLTVKEKVRKELEISEGKLVITYLGSIGTWYLLEEMLDLFNVIRNTSKEAVLLFITNDNVQDIFKVADKKGIPKESIRVRGVARNLVPDYLSISSYSLFFIKACFSKLASSPTKMGESLSMGIPVIGNSGVGDVAEIIEKYNCGIYVDRFTLQAYQEIADFVAKDNKHVKAHSIDAASAVFDLDKAIKSYEKIYASLS